MPYSSSLTDAEWGILELLLPEILPAKKRTRPSKWTKRQILDGILYQLKNGCNWEDLPKDLPPYSTVYWHLHSVAFRRGNPNPKTGVARTSARTGLKKTEVDSINHH
ncbi:MAG: transposase [Leptolyngbyaceae cyanobacterium SM1_4_3]|nr:transposase [Leptolyngbyaceae cyanobacterium SM1_4_3]